MMLAALVMLIAPDPELPSAAQAGDALLVAWSCRDEDEFTLCDPASQPIGISLTRFACRPAAPKRGERARAVCDFAGNLERHGIVRAGVRQPRAEAISAQTATFWIIDQAGVTRWRTER